MRKKCSAAPVTSSAPGEVYQAANLDQGDFATLVAQGKVEGGAGVVSRFSRLDATRIFA